MKTEYVPVGGYGYGGYGNGFLPFIGGLGLSALLMQLKTAIILLIRLFVVISEQPTRQ